MTGQDLVNLIIEKGLLNERIETFETPAICFCADTVENKDEENIFGQQLVLETLYKSPDEGGGVAYKPGDIILMKTTAYTDDYDDYDDYDE